MVRFLSEAAVVWMHEYLIRSYGGSHGIRDQNMLDSALHAPKMQWQYTGATILELAAAYCYHLCQDHPFVDGNKRLHVWLWLFSFNTVVSRLQLQSLIL